MIISRLLPEQRWSLYSVQILSNGMGTPNRSTMTIIMKLNKHLANKNFGPAGVTSVMIFAITGVLSGIVYKMTMQNYQNKR